MFSVFVPSGSSLKKAVAVDLAALPDSAVWIDMVKPTAAEDQAVHASYLQQDHLRARCHARRRQSRAEQHHLFSVTAVVLMPPTLIASIYGMNFKIMPELEWSHGYPLALVMMLLAAVGPYVFFKWKKWL
jgi:Mg2+ and Co2+ transporter CorA